MGKELSDDYKGILSRLLQLRKLKDRELAWVLGVNQRTILRRRQQYEATGEFRKRKDVSKNAEKFKPHHMEKLLEWLKEHPGARVNDMQQFLQIQCGLKISISTIKRQLQKARSEGMADNTGRCAGIRPHNQGGAEEHSMALELQGTSEGNIGNQTAMTEQYYEQRQLAPIREVLASRDEATQQGQVQAYHTAGGQQHAPVNATLDGRARRQVYG